jgi:hypothetical protein
VRWSHELSINCDTSKDTDWISSVVELVTIDVDISTTIGWTSKRSGLSNSWWVEENEFHTISNILVVQSQLQWNVIQWWRKGILRTHASGFSGGDNLSWGLSKGTKQTESIVGIIDIIEEIKWIKIITFESN